MPIKKIEIHGLNPEHPLAQVVDEINANLDNILEHVNGIDAETGVVGATGAKGDKGDPGQQGIEGPAGKDGKDGRNGIDGKDGKDGSPGLDGQDGKDGLAGEQGPAGQDGKDGKDGQPGRDGLPGRDGVDGKDGKDGLPGAMGPQGPAGVQGLRGEQGIQGIQGPAGKDGLPGATGPQGVAGPAGAQGLKGDKGDTGVVNTVTYTGPVTTVNALGQTVAQTTFTSGGYPLLCIANGDANPSGGAWVQLQWYRDGVAIGNKFHLESASGNVNCHYNIITPDTPTAGSHAYSLRTVGVMSGSWLFGEGAGPQFTFVELGGTLTAQPTPAPTTTSSPPVVGGAVNPFAPSTPVATATKGYAAAYVDAGTFVQLDNLKFTVTTGGQRGLTCATVTGTTTLAISASFAMINGGYAGNATNWSTNPTYTTTANMTGSWFGWSFPNAGDASTYNIQEVNTKNFYRVTLMIGPGYTKNFISIERLY